MTTTYAVQVFQTDRADDVDDLRRAVAAELEAVGLHKAVAVAVTEAAPPSSSPSVAVFLGSEEAATDVVVAAEIDAALADGRVVIPVVHDLNRFSSFVPSILSFANGLEWRDADGLARLVRLLLEELGIEDSQRRVFISHKRDDGLGAAEQLHDRLTHAGFLPFIDRFAVRPGAGVQDAIADALEDHAFLLLLETPLAHTSDWVFDEVDYALSHTMGTLILQWPGGVTPVPGSNGLPRIPLSTSDLSPDEHGFDLLTPAALEEAVAAIEASHAQGLCRRRRMLIKSIEEAARAAGCSSCVPLPEWRLLVHNAGGATIVGTTPRLPTAHDLQHLDEARQSGETPAGAVLVHSARVLKPDLRSHLQWVAGERDLALTPENAIGGWW